MKIKGGPSAAAMEITTNDGTPIENITSMFIAVEAGHRMHCHMNILPESLDIELGAELYTTYMGKRYRLVEVD